MYFYSIVIEHKQTDKDVPVTLLTGHSFISEFNRYLNKNFKGIEPAVILNVSNISSVKVKGWSGEIVPNFLKQRLKELPLADLVVLDIGCNDIDSRGRKPQEPAAVVNNLERLVAEFKDNRGAQYIVVCRATHKETWARLNIVPNIEMYNKKMDELNKLLEERINKLPYAHVHTHEEVLKLSEHEWTKDGLHPQGLGMIKYTESLKRAIEDGLKRGHIS